MSVSKPFERFERIARPPGKAKTAVTQFGRQPVLGSNEQIFGVKEQILRAPAAASPPSTMNCISLAIPRGSIAAAFQPPSDAAR